MGLQLEVGMGWPKENPQAEKGVRGTPRSGSCADVGRGHL